MHLVLVDCQSACGNNPEIGKRKLGWIGWGWLGGQWAARAWVGRVGFGERVELGWMRVGRVWVGRGGLGGQRAGLLIFDLCVACSASVVIARGWWATIDIAETVEDLCTKRQSSAIFAGLSTAA